MIVHAEKEQFKSETPQDGLLFRHFHGDIDAVRRFRRDMDRKEQAQLRLAIARGAVKEQPAERLRTPTASPPIDRAKLFAWLRGELAKAQDAAKDSAKEMIRAEVAALRQDLEVRVEEAIIEGFKRLEEERDDPEQEN